HRRRRRGPPGARRVERDRRPRRRRRRPRAPAPRRRRVALRGAQGSRVQPARARLLQYPQGFVPRRAPPPPRGTGPARATRVRSLAWSDPPVRRTRPRLVEARASLAAEDAEGLLGEEAARAEEADGRGQRDRGDDAEQQRARRPRPARVEREAQDGPGEERGERGAAESGARPEQGVLDGERPGEDAPRRAER